ncbi:serine/threonine-protein kinase ATM-like, partial [Trifolium medium]|nr:serine/threonine-protein kinase ATM-like [Trifolium medium]
MVIMKLCMRFGHLFTCVGRMMQVVSENWFQISFPGYGRARHQQELHVLLVFSLVTLEFHMFTLCALCKSTRIHPCKSIDYCSTGETSYNIGVCISEELLVVLMKLLMKYLMDDSVKVVDTASQTLRGILSTERGQKALHSFDSYQRSLVK